MSVLALALPHLLAQVYLQVPPLVEAQVKVLAQAHLNLKVQVNPQVLLNQNHQARAHLKVLANHHLLAQAFLDRKVQVNPQAEALALPLAPVQLPPQQKVLHYLHLSANQKVRRQAHQRVQALLLVSLQAPFRQRFILVLLSM